MMTIFDHDDYFYHDDHFCTFSDSAIASSVGVERVGVPLAESSYFATFADSSCHYALSALVLALSAKIIQKVNESSALYQLVQVFLC